MCLSFHIVCTDNSNIVGAKEILFSTSLKCCQTKDVMIMPISWRYMDVYEVIVCYITNHLDPTNYVLNFGIIALHENQT